MFVLLAWMALLGLCLSDPQSQVSILAATKCGGKEKASALLDVASVFINKTKDLYPICDDGSNCGKKEAAFAILDVTSKLISQVKNDYPNCRDTECPKQHVERPMDCSDVLRSGKMESGIYTIWPRSRIFTNKSLEVYCDMETDGGGWTVIQRRGQFSNPKDYFYKDWESYKNGFGNLAEEFWIGNDNIYAITNQASYKIRFDLEDAANNTGVAEYNKFWIEDEAASYILHIKGYEGNVGDAMSNLNRMKFSTKDRKNDLWKESCAVSEQGAWWYKSCTGANLNGLNQPGVKADQSFYWDSWTKSRMGLAGVEMKLRS